MASSYMVNAYILCGGESRRMGRNKANIHIKGRSFVDHIAHELAEHFDNIYAVTKTTHTIETDCPLIFDSALANHPLWGVAAGMQHSPHDHIFIVPCDLIKITAADIQVILDSQWPCFASGGLHSQPLLGVYPCSWLENTVNCAETGKSVYKWSGAAKPCPIPSSNLLNVNYPWECP